MDYWISYLHVILECEMLLLSFLPSRQERSGEADLQVSVRII